MLKKTLPLSIVFVTLLSSCGGRGAAETQSAVVEGPAKNGMGDVKVLVVNLVPGTHGNEQCWYSGEAKNTPLTSYVVARQASLIASFDLAAADAEARSVQQRNKTEIADLKKQKAERCDYIRTAVGETWIYLSTEIQQYAFANSFAYGSCGREMTSTSIGCRAIALHFGCETVWNNKIAVLQANGEELSKKVSEMRTLGTKIGSEKPVEMHTLKADDLSKVDLESVKKSSLQKYPSRNCPEHPRVLP